MAIRLFDFLTGLSGALDLMSAEVVGHHKRVAYIAANLARRMDLPRTERSELYMAALLHDVGGFTLQSRLAALQFEADGARHAELGYRLLRTNPLLESTALIVRHHHTPFSRFDTLSEDPRKLFLAGVLCLADRVDVLYVRFSVDPETILDRIRPLAGQMFGGEALRALLELAGEPGFWAALSTSDPTSGLAEDAALFDQRGMSRGQLTQASSAFSQIIDFRSRFTATHSRGVAETAVRLAQLAGMDAGEVTAMRLAGDLHDLGKLAVPAEILDKPGPLDADEKIVMRRHPEVGGGILSLVPGLERVHAWASQHHEQPGGQGYPLGLAGDALPLGSRLLSAADVFTALREDRPYRAGMSRAETLTVMESMAGEARLDPRAVSLLRANLAELDDARAQSQARAAEDFHRFYSGLPR
jgi:HD-GYP domain-containing protein (c-di-GMP phosphodiesterase class II)